jgi:hypothetical protein
MNDTVPWIAAGTSHRDRTRNRPWATVPGPAFGLDRLAPCEVGLTLLDLLVYG